MRSLLKFILALTVAALLMMVFRATVATVYEVEGDAMRPDYVRGDRVLVNRWSYGLRTGGSPLFAYGRWAASPVEKGDLAVFNDPCDTLRRMAARRVAIGYCTGVPGDTIKVADAAFVLPGRKRNVRVTQANMRLLCHLYKAYEGRNAAIWGGRLTVDGEPVGCASFTKDYYWFGPMPRKAVQGRTFSGIVPEDHVIGRAVMLIYSADPGEPFYDCLRPGRQLLVIRQGKEE